VNHKKIKQLIAQKQKTITDRQFFVSRILAGHFADMAAAQTRRYGYSRRVKVRIVWEPKNGELAYTENEIIWMNAGNKLVTAKKTRQDRYDLVCGLFAHELGHVLYTDFLAGQTHAIKLAAGNWFPEKPLLCSTAEKRHEADIWDYCQADPKKMEAFVYVAHNIGNIVEDGYIESKMLNRYPGILGYSLEAMREAHFDQVPTVTQLIEQEDGDDGHIWLSISQIMLSYVKWGEIKYGEEPLSDERIQTVFSLIPELDSALFNGSSKERWNVVNTILVRCWTYIKDFLETCEEMLQKALAAGTGTSPSEVLSELMAALSGTSKEGSGTSTPVAETANSVNVPTAGSKRSETARLAAKAGGTPNPDEEEQPDEEEKEAPADTPEDTEPQVEDPLSSSGSKENGQEPAQDVSDVEKGRIPLQQTDKLLEPMGGETHHEDEYAGSGYRNSGSDIERLLEQMAEKAVHTTLEKERTATLNELANDISYGNIHSGVNKRVHRINDVSDEMKEQYKDAAGPLLKISKQLQRSIKQQLQDKRRGGKQTGLLMGRRLDAHALPRNDGRVFYKNALPNEIPELAIGLLLDESGSMCSCDRSTYARASAIILYDFCKALDIPVMVYGHSTGGGSVDLYSYAEFDAIDRDDCYRMMDISSRGSNRDGAALRFIADQLSKRPEDIKLLILVSDGQPADSGYYGTAAEEDLRGIKQEYHRKGVTLIAAAIGDDKENIKRIYGDSFMDITDLSKLPVLLTDVVKRRIRV